MRRVLLIVLICTSLTAPNKVTAQNAFTPMSRSSYSRNKELFDKYFDGGPYVFVNFMMSYSLVNQPFEALNLRMSGSKSAGVITVRTKQKEYSMECSPELYSALILLARHATNTASFTMDRGGLDGADYYLFLNDNGVTSWCPDGLPEDACRLFEHIGTSVMAGDRERLESFTAVADYLYHAFKGIYHENMMQTDNSLTSTWGKDAVFTLSLSADLGSDVYKLMTYQQYCNVGGFLLQFKFDGDIFRGEYREQYSERYENLLREVGYWIYVQSDFADDSNYATFIVDDSASDPVVKETGKCRFEIRLKESDLDAGKMISLLKGIHKNRLIRFMYSDIVNSTGTAGITPDEVSAKLRESYTDILRTPVPKSMKERLGFETHPDESAAVDLGLSVKWAPFNIGAEKPEENGDYFAWGETDAKPRYDYDNYKFRESGEYGDVKFNKYNTDTDRGTVDGRTVLEPEDDAAHVKWGGNWRMPTKAEWDELYNKCTWTWTTINGVKGFRISGSKPGYSDNYIFLPAANTCDGEYMANNLAYYTDIDYYNWYWSSSLDSVSIDFAESVIFNSRHINKTSGSRIEGASIRPVLSGSAVTASEPVKEKVEIDDIYYYIYPKTRTACVTSGDIYVDDVVIPSKIKYKRKTYRVTGIDVAAFKEEYFITSVTIPESVTEIGDSAFYKCEALTEVNIPGGVKRIGRYTFADCENLTSIDIPESVTAIDFEAFHNCPALK